VDPAEVFLRTTAASGTPRPLGTETIEARRGLYGEFMKIHQIAITKAGN